VTSKLHNDHPLEIVFGTPEGDNIRFEVLGQTCPDSDTDWYRAQLNTEIHIHVGVHCGYRSLVMFSDDFHRLSGWPQATDVGKNHRCLAGNGRLSFG
jgi:hypothetical protein